jgi:hypothetical protein
LITLDNVPFLNTLHRIKKNNKILETDIGNRATTHSV